MITVKEKITYRIANPNNIFDTNSIVNDQVKGIVSSIKKAVARIDTNGENATVTILSEPSINSEKPDISIDINAETDILAQTIQTVINNHL